MSVVGLGETNVQPLIIVVPVIQDLRWGRFLDFPHQHPPLMSYKHACQHELAGSQIW